MDQAVVRSKLAAMIARAETAQGKFRSKNYAVLQVTPLYSVA